VSEQTATPEQLEEWQVQIPLDLPFRPQRQTIKGSPTNKASLTPGSVGNCYSACLASLLGLPMDEVPHIQHLRNVAEYHAAIELPWEDRRIAREWLRSTRDLDLCIVNRDSLDELGVHYILTVSSHNGPWNHAVIARLGEVVFDPSGRDDYTMADVDPEDPTAEAITLPFSPDPAEMVRRWREQHGWTADEPGGVS